MNLGDLVSRIREYNPAADIGMVEAAYAYSEDKHTGQKRMSGEPYFTHPVEVAGIIAEMRLDVPAVVTGLLHDTVEDTLATLEDIHHHFGEEVAKLVDGVTKISLLEHASVEEKQAQNVRKMLLASAEDIRVLLVKLADRAHNIRTLEHLGSDKQRRIAEETLELYVPLAHRLGINWLKAEFEDRCFRTLWPAEYEDVREKLSLHKLERDGYIREIISLVTKRLEAAGIVAEVDGRTKSAYSIWRKSRSQGLQYDDIYDVVAFRVLVDSERECYDALGVVHMNWRPVPGRFRDYVALPKANGYQSLHTTVIGPYAERLEVQVRSHEMHRVAEFGVAAHWRYKSRTGDLGEESERFEWLRQILEWQQHLDDPQEFLVGVKEDLFADEVYVFTPKGETRTLAKGETVVDFAYRIHSEIGDRCAAARINGKLVPLRYQLQQGDTVEIITTDDARPSRDWLKFVRSQRARQKILASVRRDERSKAIALGRELLERDLSRFQMDLARLHREGRIPELVRHFGATDEDGFLESVGYGRIASRQVVGFLFPDKVLEDGRPKSRITRLLALFDRAPRPLITAEAVAEGMLRFGHCCEPLPGEPVVGFLTRGRGVTVHAKACPRLADADPSRMVEVQWDKGARVPRTVRLEVTSRDRPGLLANMSRAISSAGVNIDKAWVRTEGVRAVNTFEINPSRVEELERVIRNLKRIPGVKEVTRQFS